MKYIKDHYPGKLLVAFCTPSSLSTYFKQGFKVGNTLVKMVLEQ